MKFPKNFLWGAATAAHQVEGGNFNDWSEWEKENADRLAKEAGKKWKAGQRKKFPEMFKPKNYISGRACDHYHLFEKDFDLAKQLGHNAHRFSIEWSRIEPEPGNFNQEEIEHYRRVISALKQRGIEPFVSLWHWTNPVWFAQKGGWESKDAVEYFSRYVEKIVSSFKDEVKFWITLNEPEGHAAASYLQGVFPPQKRNLLSAYCVYKNLSKAHIRAYDLIHQHIRNAQVGIAKNNSYYEAYGNKAINKLIARFLWLIRNDLFLNWIKDKQDFIGLNYYFRDLIRLNAFNLKKVVVPSFFRRNENKVVSDLGWEIYPQGIYHVLKALKKYNKPIYITENGIADSEDQKREKFIKDHLIWIHKAIKEGVDVRGYLYWSLLDNFEWDKGFWPRFGLIEIDYQTLERKIRPSAEEYAKICKENGFNL